MNKHSLYTQSIPLMSERKVGILGAMLVAIGPVSMALFTPAMTQIAQDFDTSESLVKMALSFYFAGFAIAQLVCGPLSDGFGRKPVTLGFMGIYLVSSVIALFASSIEILIAARFMQGVGAAVGIAIARAIVRDLFTSDRSVRIMNLIGLILGIGPAIAPTLGGVAVELFGWHSVFLLMLIFAIAIVLTVQFALVETVRRDLSRIKPFALLRSYGQLFGSGYFMSAGLALAGALGFFYTLAAILPFLLMKRLGLSPMDFGLSMLMQSLPFFAGNIIVRRLMGVHGAYSIIPVGIGTIATASLMLIVLLRIAEPAFITVMGPVALYAFGSAFLLPAMSTAALAPFPHIAGAAAALSGFLQMGTGLLGGLIATLFNDPALAMATVVPGLGLLSISSWLWWRRLPEPAMANVVLARTSETPH